MQSDPIHSQVSFSEQPASKQADSVEAKKNHSTKGSKEERSTVNVSDESVNSLARWAFKEMKEQGFTENDIKDLLSSDRRFREMAEYMREHSEESLSEWLRSQKSFYVQLASNSVRGKGVAILANIRSAMKKLKSLSSREDRLEYLDHKHKESKAAKTIQEAYKVFSLRKKEIIETTRRVNVDRSRMLHAEAKPLYSLSIESKEEIEDTLIKLHDWKVLSIGLQKEAFLSSESNRRINNLIIKSLKTIKSNIKKNKNNRIKIVIDKKNGNGNIQAVAIFKLDEQRLNSENKLKKIPLYIKLISSAPWNLRIQETLDDTRKVEGAATALIEMAIYESMKTGTKGAVALEAIFEAQKFYKKMGFERVYWKSSEIGLYPMELSPEKAKEFLASRRAGRAANISEAL